MPVEHVQTVVEMIFSLKPSIDYVASLKLKGRSMGGDAQETQAWLKQSDALAIEMLLQSGRIVRLKHDESGRTFDLKPPKKARS